jgi:hypothetical protein
MMRVWTPITLVLCAVSAALAADVPLGHPDFSPTPTQPVGWRGDGSGRFPGATPVTDYDPSGKNLLWRQEIPTWGHGSPIVVSKQVVVTAEPDLVLAYDADTGKPLWQADSAWTEGMPAEQALAARTALTNTCATEGKGLEDVARQFFRTYKVMHPGDYHSFGYTLPTPASDGQRIYVKCTTGTLCAYDLTGKRVWRYADPRLNASPICHSSPLVVDERVVVIVKGSIKDTVAVLALKAATGVVAWETQGVTDSGYRAASSPIAMSVDGTRLILVPGGDVLRASDGKRLAERIPVCSMGGTPVCSGPVIYGAWNGPEKKAYTSGYRLALQGDTVSVTNLFNTERSGFAIASPLVAGDALLVLNAGGLTAYDPVIGAAQPYPSKVKMTGNGHTFWPSPTLAGNVVVLPLNGGEIHVFATGRTWNPIATATLDPMTACPWFQGARTYFRTNKALCCFGNK